MYKSKADHMEYFLEHIVHVFNNNSHKDVRMHQYAKGLWYNSFTYALSLYAYTRTKETGL